ncbi:class I SAM-dependent methyltransferase [Salibacterium halotolerans]|uniref:Ubiquinone/menaquinone biosynthesis C-methylase UbiE n=1 Tax=Salibacterium halotolerans TaxID=1884432 RepID=A0A1I5UR15_9BACI|nr:methyltransferase domain-containing protein [Salibacterium halotolerans]SFP97156.1 Ubiquinone/menaquinone biosynthesis C-methylase UbiE [Salibacterium halotolerans]
MSEKKFDSKNAEKLLDEERIASLQPQQLVKHLSITPEDHIADLGAGNGLFTLLMAEQTEQPVYAVDLEPNMLDMLKDRVDTAHIHNIQYVVSDLENIQMDNDSVDKVLAAFVIHEVNSVSKALNEIKRILKSQGQCMVVEWEAKETAAGPPLSHRISSEDLIKMMRDNGFDVEYISLNNEENYAVNAIMI